jgi:hypothetical protein
VCWYADNLAGTTVTTFDLNVADVHAADHQTTLVTGAATNFLVTQDRHEVVYSREDAPTTAGIYVSRTR